MSEIDANIGKYVREIMSPKIQQILKKGSIDLNGDKKIGPDEIVDTDGNKTVDDTELGIFYQKHKAELFSAKTLEIIESQIASLLGQDGSVKPITGKPNEIKIDPKTVDTLLTVLLDKGKSYEVRMKAAEALIGVFRFDGKYTVEVLKRFAELFMRKTDGGIEELDNEYRVQKGVYELLMKEKSITPVMSLAFHGAVAWKWNLEMPKGTEVNVASIKQMAEGLYEKYKTANPMEQKEINLTLSKLMIPMRMWFFMKASGDKGVDKAIEDHNIIIASKKDAMTMLVMTIKEKDENLVPSDLRKGAFELYLRLAGKIPTAQYVDQLINLLNFKGMDNYVYDKLIPLIKQEISFKEKEFNKIYDIEIGTWMNKQKQGEYLYQQATGWWKLLSVGEYKSWQPLNEFDRTYALQSSNDDTRTSMYQSMSELGSVSILDKLYKFMKSKNKTSDYQSGRRAEEVFKKTLTELSKSSNFKLFKPGEFHHMSSFSALDPGEEYKYLKHIPGTFGFEVTKKIERKQYDFKTDFVVGYYHYLYMTFLSGGKIWDSGMITNKPRYSGDEDYGCNP